MEREELTHRVIEVDWAISMTTKGNGLPSPGADGSQSEGSLADPVFPDEPFPCPACGQLLAPTVRVCVACKQPIRLSEVRTPEAHEPLPSPAVVLGTPQLVPFPWFLFFVLLGTRLGVALVVRRYLGLLKTELALGGMEFLSAAWVLHDALRKRLPTPWRWAFGSLLLWMLFFPWYLARRRSPLSTCPFVEAQTGRVARVLLFALLVFFLLVAVAMVIKGVAS